MDGKRDPFTFELFKKAIFSIADELAVAIVGRSYSCVITDNMAHAMLDAGGNIMIEP